MIKPGQAITLENGLDYLCAETINLNNRNYLYLITASEPVKICFAEQITTGNTPQIRIVTESAEKSQILTELQSKIAQSVSQEQ